MRSPRHLSQPAYLIGGLFVVLPMLDFALSVFPPRVHITSWRFGAEGILPRALLTPLLGLLIWFVTAWFLEHRIMLRIIAAISSVVAIALTLITISFALDAVQMKAQVNPTGITAYEVTVVTTLVKDAAFILTALVLAYSSWKAGRRSSGAESTAALLIRDPATRRSPAATPPAPTLS